MNKLFAISELVSKLEKIATENRYDMVSRLMHEVYEKRMEKNPDLKVSSDDIKKTWSSVYNLNPKSDFTDKLEEVFEKEIPLTISENSPFRVAGWEEDFRPTPIESQKSEEEIIKDSSFGLLKKIATGNIVNPQYHFGQFLHIPKAGHNSGVALWTIDFNTKRGKATISVPVNVVSGKVQKPEVFYTMGSKTSLPFTAENLKSFSMAFEPDRKPLTESSGFDQIGTSTIITDRQNIKEAQSYLGEDQSTIENNNISLSYSVPIDESLTSTVGEIEKSMSKAIEEARNYVEQKVKIDSKNKQTMNINLQINYSGALGLDGNEIDPSKENVEGVFAFNATQNTRKGLKTITIPVVLANNVMEAPSFYTAENEQKTLDAPTVMNYFSTHNIENKPQSSSEPNDAFSEAFIAFLKNDATYGQIMDEIKTSIINNEFIKAASYLSIIGERFGDKILKQASDNYIELIREASSQKQKDSNVNFFINANVGFMGE